MRFLLNAKVILSSVSLLSLSAYAASQNSPYYQVDGAKDALISINPNSTENALSMDAESASGFKIIKLLNIVPSQELIAQNALNRAVIGVDAEKDYSAGVTAFKDSAGAVDVGMSNVPVLDQGQHGTCVTFAATGAVDARFNLGDYISQECTLALLLTLGNNVWNGAYMPSEMWDPFKKYGLVSKEKCPFQYPNTSYKISVDDYKKLADTTHSNDISYTYAETKAQSLDAVKAALKEGRRVLTGFYLLANWDPVSVNGFDVTVNGKKSSGGLWACKQSKSKTNYCPPQSQLNAGHEVIIIGYDDAQQLLKIRNSWGGSAGDKGDYYMTYAFFNAMSIDYSILH